MLRSASVLPRLYSTHTSLISRLGFGGSGLSSFCSACAAAANCLAVGLPCCEYVDDDDAAFFMRPPDPGVVNLQSVTKSNERTRARSPDMKPTSLIGRSGEIYSRHSPTFFLMPAFG